MAFGIDDALLTAAAGINLTDTIVKTVQAYRKKNVHIDIERLIEEVRITALQRIDEADAALIQFERMLREKDLDISQTLQDVISATKWWRPDELHRLKRFRRSFNLLADATYDAADDIAALLRCRDQTGEMGMAIVQSAETKHQLMQRLMDAESVKEAIELLKTELLRQKEQLMI